jgi:hypothetical protein
MNTATIIVAIRGHLSRAEEALADKNNTKAQTELAAVTKLVDELRAAANQNTATPR